MLGPSIAANFTILRTLSAIELLTPSACQTRRRFNQSQLIESYSAGLCLHSKSNMFLA
jgi:hypothetical protein